ncbi:MAG TPA: nicotinate-nucleotide--dimethylbenzimidazole phosphoribosyltransferase [Steroidobacteraceae bacterium]|nr:nicotinate-nucleotide--dimethylbenzimidazole phosphoribosyltransferase [Steroidobacteraceae bacterium]
MQYTRITSGITMTSAIPSVDEKHYQAARARQDQLIKPTGALGRLEDIACWFAARQGCEIPAELQPAIAVFAADHGVAAQNVSAYPAAVTRAMLSSLANGQAAIAVLARAINATYVVVDVGVNSNDSQTNVHTERIAPGTKDLSMQSAMTLQQAERAIATGQRHATQVIAQGANILIAGEVGIGNTTSAACLISALTQLDPGMLVGSGTGLDAKGRAHKLEMVKRALQRVPLKSSSAMQLLSEFGGFEIAAMTGYYLQAASEGIPVLLDGYISAAAALLAAGIQPAVREWMLASHQSAELGHALALERLQLKPLLSLGMRLGEGSGAAVAFPLLQTALRLHREMATFAEASVPNNV